MTVINLDLGQIWDAATRFRRAIENCPADTLPIRLASFPRGSCGDATPLLGTYLMECGFGEFDYVLGEKGKGQNEISHAWLGRGPLVVDITADQFPEITEAVIVTVNSPWHHAWNGKAQHGGDYRRFGIESGAGRELDIAYRELTKRMRTN